MLHRSLFSQGVHLATYSGMLAAAAIDYLYDHPEDTQCVHACMNKRIERPTTAITSSLPLFTHSTRNQTRSFGQAGKSRELKITASMEKRGLAPLTGETSEPGADGDR
jgi:hypothetical protein